METYDNRGCFMKKLVQRLSNFLPLLGLFLIFATGTPANANHSWNGYHWARTSNPFTLKVGDDVTAAWDAHLVEALGDWSVSSVLDLVKVAGSANPKNCRPTAGRIEVCNRSEERRVGKECRL